EGGRVHGRLGGRRRFLRGPGGAAPAIVQAKPGDVKVLGDADGSTIGDTGDVASDVNVDGRRRRHADAAESHLVVSHVERLPWREGMFDTRPPTVHPHALEDWLTGVQAKLGRC